jgi:hypothetical protein
VRFRRGITVAFALIAVAIVGAAAVVAVPRIQHRRALAAAIETNDAEALAHLSEDGDAALALIELYRRKLSRARASETTPSSVLRHGIEVFATTREPRDPRIEEQLRAWAGPESWPFEPVYLLEELRSPRYSDRRSALGHEGDIPWGVDVFSPVSPEFLAKLLGKRLEGADRLAKISVSAMVEPGKALRVWAACSGCELREQVDVLQIVRREHRP